MLDTEKKHLLEYTHAVKILRATAQDLKKIPLRETRGQVLRTLALDIKNNNIEMQPAGKMMRAMTRDLKKHHCSVTRGQGTAGHGTKP